MLREAVSVLIEGKAACPRLRRKFESKAPLHNGQLCIAKIARESKWGSDAPDSRGIEGFVDAFANYDISLLLWMCLVLATGA
eukprot:5490752-Amphidinium_carterae.1